MKNQHMIQITERDSDIFKILTFGPTTINGILTLLKQWYDRKMSLSALRHRTFLLQRGGYVESRLYIGQEHNYALYILSKKAIMDVVSATTIPVERIRCEFPSQHTVLHEKYVVKVLRKVETESLKLKFKYFYIDENVMRSQGKKEKYLPDLKVTVIRPALRPTIKIEVDMGSNPIIKLMRKLEYLANDREYLIVLCAAATRIANIIRAEKHSPRVTYKSKKVVLGLLNEFNEGGFSATEFVSLQNKTIRIVFD